MAAVLCAGLTEAKAETRALDSYRSIVDRNAFGLKPIEPPAEKPAPAPTNVVEKTEFYLTGITKTRNVRKAYLVNKDPNKKNYEEKYYALTIGDRQGDLTLNEIDEKSRRVKITHQGKELWLDFKSNAAPPSPAGAAPGMAGLPGAPGMPPPPGGMPLPNAGVNPAGSAPPSSPNLYQNSNPNRRVPRGAPGVVMNMGNNNAPQGPQTDAEVLKQIIELQNQDKVGQQHQHRYAVPPPPSPQFGGTPAPPSPTTP